MRNVGTVVRGIRTPIIKEGDDLASIVVESLMKAKESEGFVFKDKDIVAITEAVVGISEGNYVTVDDVKIAKNYLSEIELQRLNLLVSQFLDFAEFQALEQRAMTMEDWVKELDNQIIQNKRKLLEGNGKISHQEAIEKAEKEFNLYREREMKQLESDFDKMIKLLNDNTKNKYKY